MRCPTCHQQFAALTAEGACPLCGAEVAPLRQSAITLYIITGSIFVTVLCYSALVAIMELTHRGALSHAAAPPFLKYILLAIALSTPFIRIELRFLALKTPQGVRMAAIVTAAQCEVICLFGLVLYFLGAGVQWFVVFLALSLVDFVYLAKRVPEYARMLDECR